jgi:hypothetical protein
VAKKIRERLSVSEQAEQNLYMERLNLRRIRKYGNQRKISV